MTLHHDIPFWENARANASIFASLTLDQQHMLGIGLHTTFRQDITHFLEDLSEHALSTARATFRKIVGDEKFQLDDMPKFVWGASPSQPNVFCDGGFSNATLATYGLASYGLWLPNKTFCEQGDNL